MSPIAALLAPLGAALLAAPLLLHPAAHSHEERGHGAASTLAGRAGLAADVTREIGIGMLDTMRFTPGALAVRQGQTVRLNVRNLGQAMHEIVLGTDEEIARHRLAMQRDGAMAHGAPNMAHVAPGEQGEIVWTFGRPGTLQYACLLPGHFEAGMAGTIEVR